jgi:hypothetical protein
MGKSRINSRYAASSASSCSVGLGTELVASTGADSVGKAVEIRPIGDIAWEASSVVDTGPAVAVELVEVKEAGDGEKAAPDGGGT